MHNIGFIANIIFFPLDFTIGTGFSPIHGKK